MIQAEFVRHAMGDIGERDTYCNQVMAMTLQTAF